MDNSSETQKSNFNSKKGINPKIIILILAILIALVAIFFIFFTRSPKSAVKDYIRAINNYDAGAVINLSDLEAENAFANSYSKSDGSVTNFTENYQKNINTVNGLNGEAKEKYEKIKESYKSSLQSSLNSSKNIELKYSLKNIKAEKVEGNDNLTKVTAELVAKSKDDTKTSIATFYTLKKGLKNYVIYSEWA